MKPVTLISSNFICQAVGLLLLALSLPAIAYTEVDVGSDTESAPGRNSVYFPQFQLFETVKNEGEMLDEVTGSLDLVDECLRVVTGQGSYLLIWPGWYDFAVSGREIVISKINTGSEVARLKLGDTISLSGAELVTYPIDLQYGLPQQCLGPFWAVGDIDSVKTEIPFVKKPYDFPKRKTFRKTNDALRSTEKAFRPEKSYQRKSRGAEQSRQQLKKLEIMLEKTILK